VPRIRQQRRSNDCAVIAPLLWQKVAGTMCQWVCGGLSERVMKSVQVYLHFAWPTWPVALPGHVSAEPGCCACAYDQLAVLCLHQKQRCARGSRPANRPHLRAL
jgi:hypothetical protein